ncbi:adaptin ear-binding coat-associated protein 1/2 [Spatholobus suberectus]|nr:adaptin ear-binding coat-associated protein 1/2 [Spatholobus suberectus]
MWSTSTRFGRVRSALCRGGTTVRSTLRIQTPASSLPCFMHLGQRSNVVESVLDSLRYFVYKIEDGRDKHAFIGLWFNERNDAFDFSAVLFNHENYVCTKHGKEFGDFVAIEESHINIHSAVNHRLKVYRS